jgi:hypothetical protein
MAGKVFSWSLGICLSISIIIYIGGLISYGSIDEASKDGFLVGFPLSAGMVSLGIAIGLWLITITRGIIIIFAVLAIGGFYIYNQQQDGQDEEISNSTNRVDVM